MSGCLRLNGCVIALLVGQEVIFNFVQIQPYPDAMMGQDAGIKTY